MARPSCLPSANLVFALVSWVLGSSLGLGLCHALFHVRAAAPVFLDLFLFLLFVSGA